MAGKFRVKNLSVSLDPEFAKAIDKLRRIYVLNTHACVISLAPEQNAFCCANSFATGCPRTSRFFLAKPVGHLDDPEIYVRHVAAAKAELRAAIKELDAGKKALTAAAATQKRRYTAKAKKRVRTAGAKKPAP